MYGKKVKIMSNVAGQEGMIGIVTTQGIDDESKRKIYRVSIVPGQEGPQDSIIYFENELQDMSIDIKKEIKEAEFAENDLSVAENVIKENSTEPLNNFFTTRPADSTKAYNRRQSTLAHLEAWQTEINENYSADIGEELEALYSSALETLKTIVLIETMKISEGK